MVELIDFLHARINEDEHIAKRAAGTDGVDGRWAYDGDSAQGEVYRPDASHTYTRLDGSTGVEHSHVTQDSEGIMPSVEGDDGCHIARHDPARALREVEAKRALIAQYGDSEGAQFPDYDGGYASATQDALLLLASVYSDHPDYRKEWA